MDILIFGATFSLLGWSKAAIWQYLRTWHSRSGREYCESSNEIIEKLEQGIGPKLGTYAFPSHSTPSSCPLIPAQIDIYLIIMGIH